VQHRGHRRAPRFSAMRNRPHIAATDEAADASPSARSFALSALGLDEELSVDRCRADHARGFVL